MSMHVTSPQTVAKPFAFKSRSRRIIEWVARRHEVPVADVVGPSRFKEHVKPRWIAMGLIWRHPETQYLSMPRIGRAFGNRDHTTVRHALISLMGEKRFQRDMDRRNAWRRKQKQITDAQLKEQQRILAELNEAKRRRHAKSVVFDAELESVLRRRFLDQATYKDLCRDYGLSRWFIADRLFALFRRAISGSERDLAIIENAFGCDPEAVLEQMKTRFAAVRKLDGGAR